MSFAGAPAAAADARWDGNAGEDDQVASVSGIQAQPQTAIEFGDQAHPQAAIRFGDQAHPQAAIGSCNQVQPQSLQDFSGKQVTELVNEPKFSKQNHNFSGIQIALPNTHFNLEFCPL